MSLYHEAAEVLDKARDGGGSLRSIVFGQKKWKNDGKTLFALSAETAKWSKVLSEIIEKSDLLKERQITPTIALVLVHDLLLSRRGLALPPSHGLHATVSRHKARLSAELTKARLRRGLASLEDLRSSVNQCEDDGAAKHAVYPRWIRINGLRTTLDRELASTFADFERADGLDALARPSGRKILHIDEHVPDLIAIPSRIDVTGMEAYKSGRLILQDKASCFPACLLDPSAHDGDFLDACAAPGNKTTHLAAIRAQASNLSDADEVVDRGHKRSAFRVFACEKDAVRSQTLAKMVKTAAADKLVKVLAKQDFLKLDPHSREFRNVTGLLLDPSCSGSGIVGRDEASVTIHLPSIEAGQPATKGVKRKRGPKPPSKDESSVSIGQEPNEAVEENLVDDVADLKKLQDRLTALSAFQLRIVEHAMSFPAANTITYSTCSVHDEENEHVVVKALMSDVGRQRGWRIMTRDQQVSGMQKWPRRGSSQAVRDACAQQNASASSSSLDMDVVADGCIRCHKATEDMTMGFFVAGFTRTTEEVADDGNGEILDDDENAEAASNDDAGDEWAGFSDENSD